MHTYHGERMSLKDIRHIYYSMREAGINEAYVAFGFEQDDTKWIKFLKAMDKREGYKRFDEEYAHYMGNCNIEVTSSVIENPEVSCKDILPREVLGNFVYKGSIDGYFLYGDRHGTNYIWTGKYWIILRD